MQDDPSEPAASSASLTIDQHVGKRLQIVRRSHGLSIKTLGRALDVPVETLRRWEDGSKRIPAHQLLQLSQLLSCPLTTFFNDFPLDPSFHDEVERSESYVNAIFSRYSDAKH